MSARVLFYVQHLLGVGHLKRAEILAEAMARQGLDVTVALGGTPMPDVPFSSVRVAQLPAASIAGEDFSTLRDAQGRPVDEAWLTARRGALLELYVATEPDLVLIELFPFGRRNFRFELVPLLEATRSSVPRPAVACSVRDILVRSKAPRRDEETVELLQRYFDAVFVHGDPALVPFDATFPAAGAIADLIRYTGYVAQPVLARPDAGGEGEVIVSAGGGAVGAPLLSAALEARRHTQLADRVWRLITGPNLAPDKFESLVAAADLGVIVERFRPDFAARMTKAALSISQAGYNTSMDILRSGVAAVVVPYETASETEQRIRADLLARKGLVTVVPAAELSAQSLGAAVNRAVAARRCTTTSIDLDGARTTAQLVAALAGRHRSANPA